MNENIFGHWKTHSKTKREREKHGYSDGHTHAILAVIHAFTETDRNIEIRTRDDTIHERSVTV